MENELSRSLPIIDLQTFKAYRDRARRNFEFMLRDPSWTKARIAARILMRQQAGRVLPRDARFAKQLADDPGVTDRLIDQALASICAERKVQNYHDILQSTLAA
jgi:hypothetical protein